MSFHNLALELACNIFIEANLTTRECLPEPSSIPLVVSRVCRWWRHAALSCQALWTVYSIQGPKLAQNGPLFLARAGKSLVYVVVDSGISDYTLESFNMFIARTVCNPRALSTVSLTLYQGPLSISIGQNWIHCPPQTNITELCLCAESANTLMRKTIQDPTSFSINHASLRHVTRLTITVGDTLPFNQFIRLMPAIEHLTVHSPTKRTTPIRVPDLPSTPIIMPNLTHLRLEHSTRDFFYGDIVAPRISHLDITPGSNDIQLYDFRKFLSVVTYFAVAGPIWYLQGHLRYFLPMHHVSVLRLDLSRESWFDDHDNPEKVLGVMLRHPEVLPSLRQLHTNVVWKRTALDLLRRLQQPCLNLTIFYACSSPVEPLVGSERIEELIAQRIVSVIRQY